MIAFPENDDGERGLAITRATIANIALGNTDNHAKNHALLHVSGRWRPVLAPLYDIVPVVLDRNVHHDFAFRIGKAARLEDLRSEDFPSFVGDLGFARAGSRQKRQMSEVLNVIIASLDRLNGPRLKPLGDMIASRVKRLAEAWQLDVKTPDRDAHIEEQHLVHAGGKAIGPGHQAPDAGMRASITRTVA